MHEMGTASVHRPWPVHFVHAVHPPWTTRLCPAECGLDSGADRSGFATQVAEAIEAAKGEQFEWTVEDKNTLVLRRSKKRTVRYVK